MVVAVVVVAAAAVVVAVCMRVSSRPVVVAAAAAAINHQLAMHRVVEARRRQLPHQAVERSLVLAHDGDQRVHDRAHALQRLRQHRAGPVGRLRDEVVAEDEFRWVAATITAATCRCCTLPTTPPSC